MGTVKFNGVSSEDLGIIVQSPPTYEFPEKDYTITHIAGRNGDIVRDNKCYKNVERSYYFASIFNPGTGFIENSRSLVNWLHSASGYARLEDSYDPEVYRMALYRESEELTNILDQVTAIHAIFECKPQRYLKSGEKVKKYSLHDGMDGIVISNPTSQNAKPLIKIENENWAVNSNLSITFTHESGTIYEVTYKCPELESVPSVIFYDSDIQECYKVGTDGNFISINKNIELSNGFPVFKPGKTTITYDISSEKTENDGEIHITPRWWTL